MRLEALLSEAVSNAGRLAPLALVPLVTSLSRWNDVTSTATRRDTSFSVKFGFPYPLADLWTFLDPPSPESGGVNFDVQFVVADSLGVDLLVSAFLLVFGGGLLMAGYVGSIDQYVEEGRYEFLDNVLEYGVRMVGYQFAVLATVLSLAGPILVAPVLAFVAIPVGLALAYLFFPAPYLVVVDDLPLLEAFERSLALTTGGSEPFVFFVVYALLVAAVSVPLSVLANAGYPGVMLGAVMASPTGLVLTTFSVLFVRELVGKTAIETGATDGAPAPG